MNVKLNRTSTLILAVMAFTWPTLSHSFDLPDFFSDPLKTLPGVVERQHTLPGDTTSLSCNSHHDISQPLALGNAVDLALCNNPQIKTTWADVKLRAGSLGEAYATYLPTLTVTPAWTADRVDYSGSRYPSSETSGFTFQATAAWRLFDFGGRSANKRAADNYLQAALSTHDATLQRVLAETIQAYFNAITTSATLKAKTDNEEITRNIMNSAVTREAKGAISQSDTLRATTALARASLDKNRVYGDYLKAIAVLAQTLGLPGGKAISLPVEINEQGHAVQKDLESWLEETQIKHPAIVAAIKQLEAAKEQVTSSRSAGLPTFNVMGNYYMNNRLGESVTSANSYESTLTFSLSIPIFDGFGSTYRQQGALDQVERKTAELADVKQRVNMEVIKAYADATSALRNLESSAVLLDAAKRSLAVSQRKYDKGATDISEVLSTQAALSDAWQERVRCLSEWHSGRLQLLASVGQLGRFAISR